MHTTAHASQRRRCGWTCRFTWLLPLASSVLAGGGTPAATADDKPTGTAIVIAADAPRNVRLAAREVSRYVYLRTGALLPVSTTVAPPGDSIRLLLDTNLAPQAYRLKTADGPTRRKVLSLTGGSDVAVLYAAYDFAGKLGVRFYLHGDVVPDERITFTIPNLDETHAPLFESRGILPFHDFTQGPDWWEPDDYKACFQQMARMRLNQLGLHCYPEGPAGPEPLVWIGHPDDVGPQGEVAFSPPSAWTNTAHGRWGYAPMATGAYAAGADRLFAADDFGPSAMGGHLPQPQDVEACNEVFERSAVQLRDAFRYGRGLGVKICIGTETPLCIPQSVQARLRGMGLDPNRQSVRQLVYEGIFTRIARAYPIDRYWLWTPETWTWRGAPQAEIDAAVRDLESAMAALNKVGKPFGFGTCGWELGPKHNRALFHNLLPKEVAMSCINRNIGFNWVDPEFAGIQGRPKWAIPWLEDDSALVTPQLWVGRMRRDAADAAAYGCSGLLGIHWRTKALAPNASALAQAAWSQAGWNPDAGKAGAIPTVPENRRKRDLPCADFHADFCRAWFGKEVATEMATFLARHDGDGGATGAIQGRATMPRPNTWIYGPGAIVADRSPWEEVSKAYAFVDELARLRERVKGAGNLARFDYWLNSFRHLRAVAAVACARGALDVAMEQVKAANDPSDKRALAATRALPAREHLARCWERMMTDLLAIADTPGELGTIANLEQASRQALQLVTGHDPELTRALGVPLGVATQVSRRFRGEPRLIVPTARTVIGKDETALLKVLVLDNEPPADASLLWRTMGTGEFRRLALRHVARGVHEATLPAVPAEGAECYLRVTTRGGRALVWPPTAPAINHTLVQLP